MLTGLLLPTLGLMLLAVLVTRGFEALLPESPAGMAATACLASVALWLLSAAGFAALYAIEEPRILAMPHLRSGAGVAHFLALGGQAALVWAPVAALVVVTAPRRWKSARW